MGQRCVRPRLTHLHSAHEPRILDGTAAVRQSSRKDTGYLKAGGNAHTTAHYDVKSVTFYPGRYLSLIFSEIRHPDVFAGNEAHFI